uniref:Trafficking protein particle complex subunit n=1 Tax=Lotharella oceanica TaxID=641309 RepID=A0A7S2TRZ6_9EUKA
MSMSLPKMARLGNSTFAQMEKVNSELLAMTYGALVTTMLKDFQDVKIVNQELEKMGYNIGTRLIDEFLAKTGITQCRNLKETAHSIAEIGFKMFLGINAEVRWSSDAKTFSIEFKGNPLIEFVELPEKFKDLDYSNILCGVIRGALNMVQIVVTTQLTKSELKGDSSSEIKVSLKEVLQEKVKSDD